MTPVFLYPPYFSVANPFFQELTLHPYLLAFGQMITMLSAVFGIAIVALPAGIITAGYMEEIKKGK